jgi:hypothetical protein
MLGSGDTVYLCTGTSKLVFIVSAQCIFLKECWTLALFYPLSVLGKLFQSRLFEYCREVILRC